MTGGPTIPARPTLYRGIRMRSRLEALFAEYFDRQGWRWEYEPDCFASQDGQYLPDFRVWPGPEWVGSGADHVYVEVKPESFPDDRIKALQARMEIIRASEPAAVLWLVAGRRFWIYFPCHRSRDEHCPGGTHCGWASQ